MKYCLRCGGPLSERFVELEGRNRLVCDSCGFIFYQNPKLVAATVTEDDDGHIYLIRRGVEPRYGYWGLPAGYVELGETVEEAALRETKEETNLDVELTVLLNVYSWPGSPIVVVAFAAKVIGGEAAVGVETLEVAPFTYEEIPWPKLAFPNTVYALRDWERLRRGGVESDPRVRRVSASTLTVPHFSP